MYVAARQVYLHDRVAAVSNRVGVVTNGEALLVLEKGKRFTKVRTPKGEEGWLEDHSIIDDKLYGQFDDLSKKHHGDAPVARGTLRDDLYLHLTPGRETAHFLVLAGNTKLDLLQRGAVARTAPGAAPAPKPAAPSAAAKKANPSPTAAPQGADAPVMEDWWLVRDSSGRCGWLLARQIDVDVPDEVAVYAEGQRMVAAYTLARVMDSGVEHKAAKKGAKPARPQAEDAEAPTAGASSEHIEYVTVLAPPKNGLPYDYDQIRVFTWSMNHHRYETAYRLRGVRGYLPVVIGSDPSLRDANGQPSPTFTAEISPGPGSNINVDPDTGVIRPSAPRKISFRLEGNLIRRIGPDLGPIVADHGDDADAAKPAKKKRK